MKSFNDTTKEKEKQNQETKQKRKQNKYENKNLYFYSSFSPGRKVVIILY